VDPCGIHKPFADDCLAETSQRAWSSPIFVDYVAEGGATMAGGAASE
jgi:hypothetical protein